MLASRCESIRKCPCKRALEQQKYYVPHGSPWPFSARSTVRAYEGAAMTLEGNRPGLRCALHGGVLMSRCSSAGSTRHRRKQDGSYKMQYDDRSMAWRGSFLGSDVLSGLFGALF